MSWFVNLRLLPKMILMNALVLVMMAAMGAFTLRQMASVKDETTQISVNWLPSIKAVTAVQFEALALQRLELRHILEQSEADMAQTDAATAQSLDRMSKAQADYVKLISSPQEQALWDEVKTDWASYLDLHRQVMQLSRDSDGEGAFAIAHGAQKEVLDRTLAKLEQLVNLNHQGGQDGVAHTEQTYDAAVWSVVAAIAVTSLVGLSIAWWLGRLTAQPLQHTAQTLRAVAAGDLTMAVKHDRRDEVGDIQIALSQMIDSLGAIVQEVRMGSDSVATASAQIAQGNGDLSSRTEQQASSLEQTAASVEQMSGTVRTNADNAHQANQLASAASEVATRGGQVVSQVVDTMNDIQSSSKKISDIIGVIDGIAFQTNILALNAAVEAARAGEQGRGFAVVAGEVRSLAQRSAQAAREIKSLINDSVEKVNAGSELVSAAGATMNDVVTQVRKVTDLVGEIAHASTEQSQGIGQINQAVGHLDQMTQQNAALVEESMAAAESLKSQAGRLAQAVSVFKTRHAHDAQAQAHKVIQQVKQRSAGVASPKAAAKSVVVASKTAASNNATSHKAAAKPAAARPAVPQLPAPTKHAASTNSHAGTSGGGASDDWETF